MATKQQLIKQLRDLIEVVTNPAAYGKLLDSEIETAKRLIAEESDKPVAKPKAKAIECKPIADNLFLWVMRDGRQFKASFMHDQKYYKSIVTAANSRAAAACRASCDPKATKSAYDDWLARRSA